jgi:hypothetical protein
LTLFFLYAIFITDKIERSLKNENRYRFKYKEFKNKGKTGVTNLIQKDGILKKD